MSRSDGGQMAWIFRDSLTIFFSLKTPNQTKIKPNKMKLNKVKPNQPKKQKPNKTKPTQTFTKMCPQAT